MRSFIGAGSALLMAISLVACAEPDTADVADLSDEPLPSTLGGKGSGGTNALSGLDLGNYQMALVQAAKLYPLVDPGTSNVSAGVKNNLFGTEAGRNVFKYAVACTVPDGTDVRGDGYIFKGKGHLTAGPAWRHGPLSHGAINDLMACMVAHVNAFNVAVPILLLGAQVRDDPSDHPEFTVSEGKWVAEVNVDDVATYKVWPSTYVKRSCEDTLSAFKDRVCGQWPSGCNVELGTGSCTYDQAAEGYLCGDAYAIETKLRPEDLPLLYRQCQ